MNNATVHHLAHVFVLGAGCALVAGCSQPSSSGATASSAPAADTAMVKVVDLNGNIRVPVGYRDTYQHLGSWAIATDQGAGSKQLHDVYASPGAVAAYKTSHHFPDGTVLVKEVYDTATAAMTTGTVSRADTLKGWFVMVRDTKNSHSANKLWGDGWGWSWFDVKDPQNTTSTDYTSDCKTCHIPAQSTDWVYTQGYPALKN